jgi:hypothetical protein
MKRLIGNLVPDRAPQLQASRHRTDPRLTIALLLLTLYATIVPFWTTIIPPSTDLPQHLSQIYLLEQTLSGARTDLVVTPWYYANTLIYALIYVFWHLTDPITVGRLTLSTLAASWVLAGYFLARARNRPVENWLIGIPLTFNFLFYWGLLNLLIGWPIFCVFIVMVERASLRFRTLQLALIALLLYYAHALWFAMANVWLTLFLMLQKPKSRSSFVAAMIPAWLLALNWYPKLVESRYGSGVNTGVIWGKIPIERLNFGYFTDAALGGMQGELEPFYVYLLIAWVVGIVITRHKKLDSETDKPMLFGAALLILCYWALPEFYLNTIFFNKRWLPCGLILLLLSLPAPSIKPLYLNVIGAMTIAIFSCATIAAWRNWEHEQLDGLMNAIDQIDSRDRVFGGDMLGSGLNLKGRPNLQIAGYVQALKGCNINFSFTEHFTGAVQYSERRASKMSSRTLWSPPMSSPEYLRNFDKVLLGGDEAQHEFMRRHLRLEPVDHAQTSWRLYRPQPSRDS